MDTDQERLFHLCPSVSIRGKIFAKRRDPDKLQRKGAKAWRGKPQPKNLNRSKLRKQRRKNFVENAQFSEIALQ